MRPALSDELRDLLRDLGFSMVLVLAGELVVQLSGWPRFWVLAAALALGYSVRAVVRAVVRRRRTAVAGGRDTLSP